MQFLPTAVHPRPESAIQINETEVKTARATIEPPRKTKYSQAPSPSATRNLAAKAPVHTINNGAAVAKRKAAIKVSLWCSNRNPHLQTFTPEECNNYSRLPAAGQIEWNLL